MRTHWTSDTTFTLDGVTYRSTSDAQGLTDHDLLIFKDRPLVAQYEDLIERTNPRTIVELGIFRGGGAALIAQLAAPDKLVAVDLTPTPSRDLEAFIDAQGLQGTVVPYYGVDQADSAALDRIMASEFDGPVDLVIDDASHLYAESRASFNRLFPHVRPGGLYVIEDWSWAHLSEEKAPKHFQGVTSLSAFVCELVLTTCRIPRSVAEVTVDRHWATVRRGDAPLRPERFDVSNHFDPVATEMVAHLREVRSQTAGD